MQASNAFRSHLMQQFASAARSQSRPPLVMMPWMTDDTTTAKKKTNKNGIVASSPVAAKQQQTRSLTNRSSPAAAWSAPVSSPSSPSPCPPSNHLGRKSPPPPAHLASMAQLSSVAEDDSSHLGTTSEVIDQVQQQQQQASIAARHFQALIQTRRTTSHFDTTLSPTDSSFWKDALDRAVACGRRAPNHKRTEAFSFKRMLSPSVATERLADIAYQVSLQKSQSQENAEKKRVKWSQIPAFLVALVRAPDPLYPENDDNDDAPIQKEEDLLYHPLDFVPPQSEREMEDYASTCAAVQNVLLSLHAENIASKWATGPVIQTPAFRQLVGASSFDRVVALVMVGLPKSSSATSMAQQQQTKQQEDSNSQEEGNDISSQHQHHHHHQRKFRHDWDEVLQDL